MYKFSSPKALPDFSPPLSKILEDYMPVQMGPLFMIIHQSIPIFQDVEAINNRCMKKKLIRALMLHFIIVVVTVFYLPNKSFPSNQYHDITFLPKKLSNYSSFFSNFSRFTFQFFKGAKSIFAQSPVKGHK